MIFENKKLIIFDFDGTIINSVPDLTLATNRMLEKYNKPPLTIEEITPFIGNGAKELVKRALLHSFKKEDTANILNEAYQSYLDIYKEIVCIETYLYEGVIETLQYLTEKGYKLVICTNKPFAYIEPILEKLNIKQYFKDWIGEDSLSKKKPDALPLLHLAKINEVNVEECVMIGDSKNDILAAHNAKMQSVGLSYGYNYNENINDYNPTTVADNFSEIQKLF